MKHTIKLLEKEIKHAQSYVDMCNAYQNTNYFPNISETERKRAIKKGIKWLTKVNELKAELAFAKRQA